MLKKLTRSLSVAAIGAAAMLASTPAHAGYFVTYWSDYVGGTNVGGAYYCTGGNVLYQWGVQQGILHYDYDPSGPC